jgi:hypothetical protein
MLEDWVSLWRCFAMLVCMTWGSCRSWLCGAHNIREVRYFPSQDDLGPEMVAACLHEWFVGLDELERRLRECSLTFSRCLSLFLFLLLFIQYIYPDQSYWKCMRHQPALFSLNQNESQTERIKARLALFPTLLHVTSLL